MRTWRVPVPLTCALTLCKRSLCLLLPSSCHNSVIAMNKSGSRIDSQFSDQSGECTGKPDDLDLFDPRKSGDKRKDKWSGMSRSCILWLRESAKHNDGERVSWSRQREIRCISSLTEPHSRDREDLEAIGARLGVTHLEKWYSVRNSDVIRAKGRALLARHNNSLSAALVYAYPEHRWNLALFAKKPKSYWKSRENQKEFLLFVQQKLGIEAGDLESWYKVGYDKFVEHGGRNLLREYNHSLSAALKALFPEHFWDESRFLRRPRHYWSSLQNRREFLESLRLKLGIGEDMNGWYNVTYDDFVRHGGARLLQLNDYSIAQILTSVYTEHDWDHGNFSSKSRSYWHSLGNQRMFMNKLAENLGFGKDEWEFWYGVDTETIREHGGAGLLSFYGNSLSAALLRIYPHYNWELSKFSKKPQAFWNSADNQRTQVESIAAKLGFSPSEMDMWYSVLRRDFVKFGGAPLLLRFGSLANVLRSVYPEHEWKLDAFVGAYESSNTQDSRRERIDSQNDYSNKPAPRSLGSTVHGGTCRE